MHTTLGPIHMHYVLGKVALECGKPNPNHLLLLCHSSYTKIQIVTMYQFYT